MTESAKPSQDRMEAAMKKMEELRAAVTPKSVERQLAYSRGQKIKALCQLMIGG